MTLVPSPPPATGKISQGVCPLCKALVDEPGAYDLYRLTEKYLHGVYPDWAYYTHGADSKEPLPYHLVNFHRLPESVALELGVILGELAPLAEGAVQMSAPGTLTPEERLVYLAYLLGELYQHMEDEHVEKALVGHSLLNLYPKIANGWTKTEGTDLGKAFGIPPTSDEITEVERILRKVKAWQ